MSARKCMETFISPSTAPAKSEPKGQGHAGKDISAFPLKQPSWTLENHLTLLWFFPYKTPSQRFSGNPFLVWLLCIHTCQEQSFNKHLIQWLLLSVTPHTVAFILSLWNTHCPLNLNVVYCYYSRIVFNLFYTWEAYTGDIVGLVSDHRNKASHNLAGGGSCLQFVKTQHLWTATKRGTPCWLLFTRWEGLIDAHLTHMQLNMYLASELQSKNLLRLSRIASFTNVASSRWSGFFIYSMANLIFIGL